MLGDTYYVLVVPTLLWVLDINSSHKNTLDPWGDGGCCSAFVVKAVAASRAVQTEDKSIRFSAGES